MKDPKTQATSSELPPADDGREDYEAPELQHLGDVSTITQGAGCNNGADGAYS